MDHRARLVVLLLALVAGSASAGYALPSPPSGFGGSPGGWTFTPPANAPTLGGGSPASNSPLFRGPGPALGGAGGAAESGAVYRVAGGGARVLAGRAVAGLIPGLGLALAVGWLASNCFEKQNGAWVRTCLPGEAPAQPSAGEVFRVEGSQITGPFSSTRSGACAGASPLYNTFVRSLGYAAGRLSWSSGLACDAYTVSGTEPEAPNGYQPISQQACPTGWYVTPAGCVQTPNFQPVPVTPEQIVEEMAPKPLPNPLPLGVPYPLDPSSPFIFNPTPGDNPQGQPLRVPQGNPVPIPNTNPQQYRQPMTRWTHSPTLAEPWRMDVRPEDVVGTDPVGQTAPQSVTSGSPSGDKPEQVDLCKEHPDIIACQVFKPDDLQPLPVPNKQVPLALNAEGGFPTGGACPQPKSVTLLGKVFSFSMQPLCDFALGIKPLLIGFAWLSAALIFLGVARREN